MGENVDWTLGPVITAAFAAHGTWVEASPSSPVELAVTYAGDADGLDYAGRRPADFDPSASMRYVLGVLRTLEAEGLALPPLSLHVRSNVPSAGGLATSASFCAAMIGAVCELLGRSLTPRALGRLGFLAEHEGAAVQCGLMDPYAVALGSLRFLDCAADPPSTSPIPVPDQLKLVVACSRRRFRFMDVQGALSDRWERREPALVRYVEACAALAKDVAARPGDLTRLGAAVNQADELIRREMGATNPEIDSLVALARDSGAYGAKSCGGRPVGGSLVAITDSERAPLVAARLRAAGASVFVDAVGAMAQ